MGDNLFIMLSGLGKENGISFSDLGLMVERFYSSPKEDEEYKELLDNSDLTEELNFNNSDIELITYYLLYKLLDTNNSYSAQMAWCLGKCFELDLCPQLISLMNVYINDDLVLSQLLAGFNAHSTINTPLEPLKSIRNHINSRRSFYHKSSYIINDIFKIDD
jgi:hypothetical protein